MHEFEELGAGLLLGRIDILIAVDDVDVDGELRSVRGERSVLFGDLGITLRPEVPEGRRVFDQEGEGVGVEKRQDAAGIRADGVFHAGVEAVVNVGQDEVETGAVQRKFRLRRSIHPACGGRDRRGSRERRRDSASLWLAQISMGSQP